MSLNNRWVFLSELGRREEALAAIEEAVTAYRALAQARPDAFLPDLATSLNNQSGRLADLGRREEALAAIEEAVTTYRALAQAPPVVFASRYASSLKAQAALLSELGRDSEAEAVQQEAHTIRGNRRLARAIRGARRYYSPGGCHQPAAACEVHHLRHKGRGGQTSLENCILLCWYHHHVVIHRMGWTLVRHPDATTTAR